MVELLPVTPASMAARGVARALARTSGEMESGPPCIFTEVANACGRGVRGSSMYFGGPAPASGEVVALSKRRVRRKDVVAAARIFEDSSLRLNGCPVPAGTKKHKKQSPYIITELQGSRRQS